MHSSGTIIGQVLSESLLSLDEGVDTVDHILNELLLRSAESSSVGDIEDAVIGLGVLTMDTSDLDVVLLSDGLELVLLGHELWKLNVDGASESSTKVGRAGGDVAKVVVVSELTDGLDVSGGSAESVEDLGDASTLLHGNDSKLILLVNPDEESLGIVVEDTSTRGPVSVEVASLEESIAFPNKELDTEFVII